ncbi:hypothetical protein Tco_0022655, partial [Tanacetum coccineum]
MYGAILPNELTNEAIKDFESYKEYYAISSRAEPPKTKASVKKKQVGSDKTKTPPTAKGKRLKTSAKAAKPAKKKQPAKTPKAKGLTVLFEVALTEAEQMKLATKRSPIQTHRSHASRSGADEGTGEEDDDEVGKNDGDDDNDDDDDADNQDYDGQEDDGQEYDGQDEIIKMMIMSKLIQTTMVMTLFIPNEEETNEEDEVHELYRDVNVNLEGRDTKMTDAPHTIIQTTQVIEDTHVIIALVNPEGQQQSSSMSSGFVSNMLNPSLDTCIDSIFNLNTKSTSLVDVPVTTIAETPLSSATTLPPPTIPLITHMQQTPIPTPTTIPSSPLQDLSNFG